ARRLRHADPLDPGAPAAARRRGALPARARADVHARPRAQDELLPARPRGVAPDPRGLNRAASGRRSFGLARVARLRRPFRAGKSMSDQKVDGVSLNAEGVEREELEVDVLVV